MLGTVFFAVVLHLLLAFPSGRLQSLAERRIVAAAYLLTTVCNLPLWLFADPEELDCDDCPAQPDPDRLEGVAGHHGVSASSTWSARVVVLSVLFVMVRRWRRATAAQRRFLVPVYSAGVAVLLLLIVLVSAQAGGVEAKALDVLWVAAMVPFALVPYLFLYTLVRTRMIQSGAVGELMARLGETPARGELRDALGARAGRPDARARLLAARGPSASSTRAAASSSCPRAAPAGR